MTTGLVAGTETAVMLARAQLDALGLSDVVDPIVDVAGPVDLPLSDETLVQAACGIMHIHGRARGAPEPLAVDYASTVAGVLAVQGVLAAAFATARGGQVSAVRTSVAQAALLSVTQYLACAAAGSSCGPSVDVGHPPPFVSADGVWFEIETLRAEDWQRFWRTAGATEDDLRQGWPPFLHRFATATCPLPLSLHTTLRRLSYHTVTSAGHASGVSVVRLGDCDPVPPWTFTPLPGRFNAIRLSCVDTMTPLADVRVVESTGRVQGPMAGHVLRMLGADVVRIEPPGGDPQRGTPPLSGSVSARFAALNSGKRAIEIDLNAPAGRDEARDLVRDADVFLHNWAPGRASKWRLDAADLVAVRPGLVYAYASGWGRHFGCHPPLGTDYLVQAHSGLAAALRPPGEPAAPSLMTLTDVLGGLVCAQGVLAALVRRERTGTGSEVDTSLLSAAGVVPRTENPQWIELDRPLRTADGYLALSRAAARQPAMVADALGGPISATCRNHVTAELLDRLLQHDLSAAAVTTDLRSLITDPRFAKALHNPPWEFM